jgi:hypothetical protein
MGKGGRKGKGCFACGGPHSVRDCTDEAALATYNSKKGKGGGDSGGAKGAGKEDKPKPPSKKDEPKGPRKNNRAKGDKGGKNEEVDRSRDAHSANAAASNRMGAPPPLSGSQGLPTIAASGRETGWMVNDAPPPAEAGAVYAPASGIGLEALYATPSSTTAYAMMVASVWAAYQGANYDTTMMLTVTYDAFNYACWAVFVYVGMMQLYNGLGKEERSLFGLDQYAKKDIAEISGLDGDVMRMVPQCFWSLATELHSPRVIYEDSGSTTMVYFPCVDMRAYPVPITGWFSRLILWPQRFFRERLMREHLQYMQYLDSHGNPLPNRDPPWVAHQDFWQDRVFFESFSQDKVVRLGAKYSRALASFHVSWPFVSPGDPLVSGLSTEQIAKALRGRFGLGDITTPGVGFTAAQQLRDFQATFAFPTIGALVPHRISFISAQATPCCEPGFGDGSPDLAVTINPRVGTKPFVSDDWQSYRMLGRTGIDPIFVGWVWKEFSKGLGRLGFNLQLVEMDSKKCFGGGVSPYYYNYGVDPTSAWLDPRLLLFPTTGPPLPFQGLIPALTVQDWNLRQEVVNKDKISIISRSVTAADLESTQQILTRPASNTYVAGYTGVALPAWTAVGPMVLPLPAQRRFLFSTRKPKGQTGYDPYMRAPLNPLACEVDDYKVRTILESLSNRANVMLLRVTRVIFGSD